DGLVRHHGAELHDELAEALPEDRGVHLGHAVVLRHAVQVDVLGPRGPRGRGGEEQGDGERPARHAPEGSTGSGPLTTPAGGRYVPGPEPPMSQADPAALLQPAATRVRDPLSGRSVWLAGMIRNPRPKGEDLIYDLWF